MISLIEDKDGQALNQQFCATTAEGRCYEFAAAVSEGAGYPMVGVRQDGVIVHAMVRHPDGFFMDGRGFMDEAVAVGPYVSGKPYELIDVTLADLRAVRPVDDHAIESIRSMAERAWPHLPWKDSHVSRARAFAEELEALCRKHRLELRAAYPNPATWPVIQPLGDGFAGFQLMPCSTGDVFAFDRLLDNQIPQPL